MKKHYKTIIAILIVIIIGVGAFAIFYKSSEANNTQYDKHAKQVTSLIEQANGVGSIEEAASLLHEIDLLEDELSFFDEQMEYDGSLLLQFKVNRIENKLEKAKDKLEVRWRIDS